MEKDKIETLTNTAENKILDDKTADYVMESMRPNSKERNQTFAYVEVTPQIKNQTMQVRSIGSR